MAVLLWDIKKINNVKLRVDTSKTAITILFKLCQLLLSLRKVKVLSRKFSKSVGSPPHLTGEWGLTAAKGNGK